MRRLCFALSHIFVKRFPSKQTKNNNINCNKNCLIYFSISLPFDNLLHIPTWDPAMSCTFISVLFYFLKSCFYEKTTTEGGRWLEKVKSILNEWLGKPQVSAFNNTRWFYRKMENFIHMNLTWLYTIIRLCSFLSFGQIFFHRFFIHLDME